MIRRLFIAASVSSTLVCIVTASLWMLSYRRSMTVTYERLLQSNSADTDPPADKYVSLSVTLNDGVLFADREFVHEPYVVPKKLSMSYEPAVSHDLQKLGFVSHAGLVYVLRYPHDIVVGCRCWAIVGLAAITAAAFAFRRFSPRKEPGQCPACGYDLRASTDRCPECGTPIPAKSLHGRRAWPSPAGAHGLGTRSPR